jgi:hypothetical protein
MILLPIGERYFISTRPATTPEKQPAQIRIYTYILKLVPMAGLEPAQLSPLPPQGSVSTNSTTSASNTD